MFKNQPKAFNMIFLLEVWERFGFYTVQGVLTLYFLRFLNLSSVDAYYTFGAFFALVYGIVPVGGYLGDKILGTKRTIFLGLVLLALGYLSLALASRNNVYYALALICVGNGIFKANPSNLLAKCYEENDSRLHAGFTLYYMAVNLGSTFSLFLGPFLADTYGYFYAYFVSFIGLVLGILNYIFQYHYVKNINTEADLRNVSLLKWAMILGFLGLCVLISTYLLQHVAIARNLTLIMLAVVFVMYFRYMMQESIVIKRRMLLALILMLEGMVFFILYQQMPTSLNLFAVHNVEPQLFGITINPQSFQALNPIWIILLSPLFARIYTNLNTRGVIVNVPVKFALGMSLSAISFILLYFARFFHTDGGVVSYWWLIASYFFQSSGELLVSALGVAMVAELTPPKVTGFVMGVWFLTTAVAGFLGGYVAAFAALPKDLQPSVASLMIYTDVFLWIGLITLLVSVFFWIISPYLNRLLQ